MIQGSIVKYPKWISSRVFTGFGHFGVSTMVYPPRAFFFPSTYVSIPAPVYSREEILAIQSAFRLLFGLWNQNYCNFAEIAKDVWKGQRKDKLVIYKNTILKKIDWNFFPSYHGFLASRNFLPIFARVFPGRDKKIYIKKAQIYLRLPTMLWLKNVYLDRISY